MFTQVYSKTKDLDALLIIGGDFNDAKDTACSHKLFYFSPLAHTCFANVVRFSITSSANRQIETNIYFWRNAT